MDQDRAPKPPIVPLDRVSQQVDETSVAFLGHIHILLELIIIVEKPLWASVNIVLNSHDGNMDLK